MTQTSLTRRSLLLGAVPAIGLGSVAAQAKAPASNFLVVGDWGRGGCCEQVAVAEQMSRRAVAVGSQYVISVGDNFYENGVTSVTDPQWKTSFEDVYNRTGLMTTWNVILGNHDYQGTGNPQAQIEYGRINKRWWLPSPYYQRSERLADGTTADFFYVDTAGYIDYYFQPGSRVHANRSHNEQQLQWLERGLAASQAAWKIVVGHHEVFAVAPVGDYVGDDISKVFKPLIDRYGVQAYINGHEHNLQHIVRDKVSYITCGAGSRTDPVEAPPGQFASGRHGFMSMRLEKDTLSFAFIDMLGQTLYQTAIPRQA